MADQDIQFRILASNETQAAIAQVKNDFAQMKAVGEGANNGLRESTHEARAAMALLGEETGVKMSRHLRSLLADSALLRGAFAAMLPVAMVGAVAIYFEQIGEGIRKGSDYLTGFTKGLKDAGEEAVKLNVKLMTSFKTLDQGREYIAGFNKAITDAQAKQEKIGPLNWWGAVPIVGGVASTLQAFHDRNKAIDEGTKATANRNAALEHQTELQDKLNAKPAGMFPSKDEWIKTQWADQEKAATEAAAAAKQYAEGLEKAKEQIAEILVRTSGNPFAKILADQVKEYQKLNDMAEKFGKDTALATDIAQAKLQLELETRRKIREEEEKLLEAANKAVKEMAQGQKPPALQSFPGAQMTYGGPAITPWSLGMSDLMRDQSAQGEAAAQIWVNTRNAAEQYANELTRLNFLYQSGKLDAETYNRAVAGLKNSLDPNLIAMRQFGQEVGSAFEQALLYGRSWQDFLKTVLFDVIKLIAQMTIMKSLQNSTGVGGNFLSGLLGGFLHFAGGGQPPVGVPSLVGENGPELFVPSVNGTIYNSKQVGGTNVYIDARGAQAGVENRIAGAMALTEARAVARAKAELREENARM